MHQEQYLRVSLTYSINGYRILLQSEVFFHEKAFFPIFNILLGAKINKNTELSQEDKRKIEENGDNIWRIAEKCVILHSLTQK